MTEHRLEESVSANKQIKIDKKVHRKSPCLSIGKWITGVECNKCWNVCGTSRIFIHYFGENKYLQLLWKTVQ